MSDRYKFQFVVQELKNPFDVKQMLHSEKLDFMGFYRFENVQKQRIILDLFSGEDVIIMLKEKMQ